MKAKSRRLEVYWRQFDVKQLFLHSAAFLTKKCRVPEDPSKIIKFEIWDTGVLETMSPRIFDLIRV